MIKERPILFNGEMVRAILSGQKTQTRRVIKPQPEWQGTITDSENDPSNYSWKYCDRYDEPISLKDILEKYQHSMPHGQKGERLWVRETFTDTKGMGFDDRFYYRADVREGSDADVQRKAFGVVWRPSIFMPREACRILLEITDVRVERLQNMPEEDVRKEGLREYYCEGCGYTKRDCGIQMDHHLCSFPDPPSSISRFQSLWDSINKKRGQGWDINPFVWSITFKRIEP